MNDAVHTYTFRIALHDTDAAGVLFFAHLFRHAHDAYETFMAKIGWPLDTMIRDRALALPLVHAEADYSRPMSHGQQVEIAITVADIADGRFSIDYRFTDPDGALLARARTIHAAVDPIRSRPVPLPSGLTAALRRQAKPHAEPPGPDRLR